MTDTPSAVPVMNVTKAEILRGLRAFGIVPGDALLVHSSLKSMGRVEGGADTVIDALIEAVGPDGIIAVPTHTASDARPEDSQPDYKPDPFHPAKTVSRTGLITEMLRKRPEAVRSLHPTHSVAAIGRGADEMVRFHGPESHFGRHTPYGWLVRRGAKILLIGVKMNSNTLIHMIEDLADMPSLSDNRVVVEDDDGTVREIVVHGAPLGHRDFYYRRLVSKAEKALRARGAVTDGKIGAADCMLVDAQTQELILMREVLGSQSDILCCERPACTFCPKVRAAMMLRFAKGR